MSAQKHIGVAIKSETNTFFKGSKYAALPAVIEACKEALNQAGIVVLQPLTYDETGYYVETILLHASGEKLSAKIKLILAKQDMQAIGSACSYARRYGIQSFLFIPSSEDEKDDDGNASSGKIKPPEDQSIDERIIHAGVKLGLSDDDAFKICKDLFNAPYNRLGLEQKGTLLAWLNTEINARRSQK